MSTELERQAERDLAQADLYFYSRFMFYRRKHFKWRRNWHHKVICDALMDVFHGRRRNVIINLPPRYSKTELAVTNFCSWALGKVPDAEFIHTSYSTMLAVKNSAGVREQIQHEAFGEIFPGVRLALDATAKDHWKTTAGGVFYATGSGGTLTGFGAGKAREGFGGAIVIDDPHKADEATSDTMRGNVIDWYQNTLESRRNSPETPIILIMQRLHEDDLAGWLLAGKSGEHFDHIMIPAISVEGEALWPWKHDIETLRVMEKKKPYVFAGQYGQRPAPAEGGIFKPDLITIVDALPRGLRLARGWDFAATDENEKGKNGKVKAEPDYTAGAKLGIDEVGRVFITDMNHFRGSPLEVERSLKNTADRDGHGTLISIPQDPGQAGKAQAQMFVRMLGGYTVEATVETGSKATRAAPLASQVEAGNVFMLRAPWNDGLISEMRMFPNGSFDDQVDACSRAYARLVLKKGGAFGSV